jgi:hypothetical protein
MILRMRGVQTLKTRRAVLERLSEKPSSSGERQGTGRPVIASITADIE